MVIDVMSQPPAIAGHGYWDDTFVKTPDGWRIITRTLGENGRISSGHTSVVAGIGVLVLAIDPPARDIRTFKSLQTRPHPERYFEASLLSRARSPAKVFVTL